MGKRKHAALLGDEVVAVLNIDEAEYAELIKNHSLILDIEDYLVQPEVGWKFANGKFRPGPNEEVDISKIINARIRRYQQMSAELLAELYTQNTLMGITLQQSDQMFDEYQDVLIRLREGAWPTAIYRLQQKQPSGFVTQEMIDSWIELIQSKMI